MSFPHTFGPLTSPVPLQDLDDNFNAISASSGVSLVGFGSRTLQAAMLEAPIVCTSVKTGTTGVNTYTLTISNTPPGLTLALTNGYRFQFTPDASCTGGAAKLNITAFSDGPLFLFAPDGRELVSYYDVSEGRTITVEYRNNLPGFSAVGFVLVDQVVTQSQAAFGHGRGKLQSAGAGALNWTQDDGHGLLVWDPVQGSFRLSSFATISNGTLFSATNYVKGVANTALSTNTFYAVYYYDPNPDGNVRVLDFWPIVEGGVQAWTPIVNEIGIMTKCLTSGGAGIDDTRTFLGLIYTAGSDITTNLTGPVGTIRCQSHFSLWRFPFDLDLSTVSGVTSTTFVTQSTPRFEFVTEGVTDAGQFRLHCNYYNTTANTLGEIQLQITGTAFNGTPFSATSKIARHTCGAANAYGNMTAEWGVAVPMGYYVVQPAVRVNGGSGTFELWMDGCIAE